MNKPTVYDCSVIELPKITNRAGNITPIHGNVNVPFSIRRVFYTYDIPGKRTVLLNRPFYGLHIPPGIWASEQGFSSGAICLVLASERYDAEDYIRDYQEFLEYKNG